MYKEIFPKRLREARKNFGYTQAAVSELTGIRRSKISKLECGCLEPDLESLGTLASLYQVSVDWLLGLDKYNILKN